MEMPGSYTFNSEVEQTFIFLADNGFSVSDRVDTSLTAGVTFRGRHVAVSFRLDRRDAGVDCYVTRMAGGKSLKNDAPGGSRQGLYTFLVKHRGYRGAFKEFKIEDGLLAWYQADLLKIANAIKALAPDIVEDSPSIFIES
jgi:hypothetical protein